MNWQAIVQKNNLGATVISSSKLSFDMRLDAEYYQAQPLIEKIAKKNTKKLSKLSDWITQGPNPQFVEQGIPCLTGRNIAKGELVFDGADQVNENEFAQLKRFSLQKNDVLITLKGAGSTGKVALFSIDAKAMFSRNLGLVRLSEGHITPEYLFAFFSSSLGQIVIDRGVTGGTGQLTLPTSYLKNLDIPIPSNQLITAISLLISKQSEYQVLAKESYSQAEQLLLTDLNLANYKPSSVNTSTRNLVDCLADDRFDAEYWQPKYDEIQERVVSVPQSKLGKLVNHKKGIEVGSEAYQDEGKNFIRVSDFSNLGIEEVEKKISDELYQNLKKNYEPKKGEVLFTKDGTIGLSFALNEDVEGIISGAFLRLQPKVDLNTNYLALVLNSPYCKAQIERMSGGAIIAHLKPESAMQISIPVLARPRQDELGEMAIKSLRMRKEAKTLLEKAKRAVEIFIEQDEVSALAYLSQI